MATELWMASFSPWVVKARWALDLAGIEYKRVNYTPVVHSLPLALKSRRLFRRVTIPALFVDGRAPLMDSRDIAKYAAETLPDLWPDLHRGDVLHWDKRSDYIMQAGRAIQLARIRDTPEAMLEFAQGLPGASENARLRIASFVVGRLQSKYRTRDKSRKAHMEALRDTLAIVSKRLESRRYLAGGFSYADIAIATSLTFVKPPENRFYAARPAIQDCTTIPELAMEFSHLFTWREKIMERHAPTPIHASTETRA